MAYTKNEDPWAAEDIITTAKMDNFETIYTEISGYLAAHDHDALYQTKAEMEAAYWYSGNDGSGSGADADLLYHSGGNLHAASFLGLGVPVGLIIMWSGVSAPSGWHLCDGSEGYIDLRDRFIYGAGTVAVGTNGSGSHTPTGTVSVAGHALTTGEVRGHQHTYTDRYADAYGPQYFEAFTSACWSGYHAETSPVTGNSNIGKTPADAHGHSSAEGTAFTGVAFTALPPYYALAFIQKTA
jgi:hypothetical protein